MDEIERFYLSLRKNKSQKPRHRDVVSSANIVLYQRRTGMIKQSRRCGLRRLKQPKSMIGWVEFSRTYPDTETDPVLTDSQSWGSKSDFSPLGFGME